MKCDNELSQLMKWGDFITKIGEMDCWKALEVLPEGKKVLPLKFKTHLPTVCHSNRISASAFSY